MSFDADLARFAAKLRARERAVFVNTVSAVKSSIVDGSAVTGSPGQPVGQYGPGYHPGRVGGTLKASWQVTFESPTSALISTKIAYAPVIEYNLRGAQLRSTVGGFHSVAYTVGGFTRLVDAETRKLNP